MTKPSYRSVVLGCVLLAACRRSATAPLDPAAPGTNDAAASPLAASADRAPTPSDASLALPAAPASATDDDAATSLSSLLSSDESDAAPRPRERIISPPRAGESIAIPATQFAAGSTPGDEGRDPKLEPVQMPVSLSAYEIDRLPYPNDPSEPLRTDVTLKEAARLCSARGQRLCTELEWEYACRGPDGDLYATGGAWDPACKAAPLRCAASTGALGLGSQREWTASEVLTPDSNAVPKPAVRGSSGDEPTEHRCAHRSAVPAAAHGRDLAFRCCRGPANDMPIPAPRLGPTIRKFTITPGELAEIFASIPRLASIQAPVRYFAEPEDPATVLRRGKAADTPTPDGYTLTTSPLLWNPVPGDELLLAAGRSARDSFIVALYRLPDNRYRLASSMLLLNDVGPFVLAYRPDVRERLLWSSCWKCAGEGGAVTVRDGRRVVIVQQ